MRKAFRFLAAVALLGLLPAAFALGGFDLFLSYVEAQRNKEGLFALAESLRELDRRVLEDRDKAGIARRIRDEFAALDRFDTAEVDAIAGKWHRRYPGVFQIVLVGIEIPREDKVYSIVGTRRPKMEWAYTDLARIVNAHEVRGGGGLSKEVALRRKIPLVAKQLLGAPATFVESIALRLDSANDCRFENKVASFYLDYFYDNRLGRAGRQSGFLFLHIFEEEARKRFSEETTLAEFSARVKGRGFEIGFGRRGSSAVEIHRGDPVVGKALAGTVRSRLDVVGQERLYSFLPASFGVGGDIFCHASIARDRVFPERATREAFARLLALLHLLAVAVVALLVTSGRLRFYLSVRLQLAALFVAAVFLPFAVTFVLGLEYLSLKRDALVREKHNELLARIAEADADAGKTIERLRLETLDIIRRDATPAALDCLAAHPKGEIDLHDSDEVRARHFRELERICALRRDAGEFDDFFIYDESGRLLWKRTAAPPTFLENSFLREMAIGILEQANEGKIKPGEPGKKRPQDFISGLVANQTGAFTEDLVKKRGLVNRIHVLKYRLCLMIEPLFLDGRAAAVFGVTYLEDNLMRNAVRTAVLQSATAGGDLVRLRGGHAKLTDRQNRHPDPSWFDASLEELLVRTARENAPQLGEIDATIETRLPGRGAAEGELVFRRERAVFAATPMKEASGQVMIALYPLSAIDGEIGRMQGMLAAVLALSVVLAAAIGLAIARRFLVPVRKIEEGVRAIARGELDIRLGLDSADEFGDLSRTFDGMVAGLREKERMSRYVSEFVLDEVKREGGAERLGETRKVTILFSDIRDFTTISEAHPAEEIVSMLNDYFEAMAEVIRAHGGVIDKFIGDAVMAVFDPAASRVRGDEARGILCALGMRAALERFNAERSRRGLFTVENGVGVHTGEVIRGDIGAKGVRVDHTVIGDGVNLAARLESVSKHGRHTKIILSDRTLEAVASLVHVTPLEQTSVKGKTKSVRMFEVVGLKSPGEFLPGLTDADAGARAEALSALSALRDPAVAPAFVPLLSDPEPAVRRAASRALALLPEARAVAAPALLLALSAEKDAGTRASLVSAIGECGDDDDRIALERHLADEDPRVRANAIEAIGQASDRPRLAARLRGYAADANNRIRGNACVLLVSLGEVGAIDDLIAMLASPDPLMRASGAWGLGEIATPERLERLKGVAGSADALVDAGLFSRLDRAAAALHGLLADPDRMVARNVLRALGRIGHRASTPFLVDAYRAAPDEESRHLALAALEEVGARNVARALRGA